MRNQKIALESLSMDLKRVTLGLQRGSKKIVRQFTEEALQRKKEIDLKYVDSYIRKILGKLPVVLKEGDEKKKAEDLLMYSILLQNYVRKKYL